jgi:hypothetical protein
MHMRRLVSTSPLAALLLLSSVSAGIAQGGTPGPTPGPTNPTPTNPQAKAGSTIVVNPTVEECRRGWSTGLKWTKEQFDEFCSKMQASK